MVNLYVKSESDPEDVCFIFRDSGEEIRIQVHTEVWRKNRAKSRKGITLEEYNYIREHFEKPSQVF